MRSTGIGGVIPSQTANTATSPLTVGLLAAITAVVRGPVLAVGLLLMATTAASAVWLLRIAEMTGLSRWLLPTLGVGLLLSSPLLASTIGLETYLCVALFIGLVRYALAGRWLATGIVAGLLVLGRPDLAVVDVRGVPWETPAEFELVWEKTCVNAIGEWRSTYRSEALCLKNVS